MFVSSSFNLSFLIRQSFFLYKAVMLIRHHFLSCHFLGNLNLSYRSFRESFLKLFLSLGTLLFIRAVICYLLFFISDPLSCHVCL